MVSGRTFEPSYGQSQTIERLDYAVTSVQAVLAQAGVLPANLLATMATVRTAVHGALNSAFNPPEKK